MSSKEHGFWESLAISFGNWLLRKIGEYHRELCPFVFAAIAFGCAYAVATWLGYLAALAAFCLSAYWNWSLAALRKHGERRRLDRLVKALPGVFERLGLVCRIPDSQGDFLSPKVLRWERLPGGGCRLDLRLPLGITLADVQNRSEALAGALGGSSADVAAASSRKAHEVVLTVVGVDDLLYGAPLAPEPLYALEPGRSVLEPALVGYDSFGMPVYTTLFESSFLIGGSPGAGKSVCMHSFVFAAAVSRDAELWLLDPKGGVELVGFWKDCAKRFWRPREAKEGEDQKLVSAENINAALEILDDLIAEMDLRYAHLLETGSQKIEVSPDTPLIVLAIDELAELTAHTDKNKANDLSARLRLIVAKGRSAGITPIFATQKPSTDVVPSFLRDLFSTCIAFRCGRQAQAITILGEEAVKERGADASRIGKDTPGLGYLFGDTGGEATRLRTYFLDKADMKALSAKAAAYRASLTSAVPNTFSAADSSHSRPLTTQGGQNENVSQITSEPSVITCPEHEHLAGHLDAAALSIVHDCPSCVYYEGAD